MIGLPSPSGKGIIMKKQMVRVGQATRSQRVILSGELAALLNPEPSREALAKISRLECASRQATFRLRNIKLG